MSLRVWAPGDWVPDDGNDGKEYPIIDKPDLQEIVYDKWIQNMSYITANIVAVFNQWFCSFFEPSYFKFVRIKTQSTLADFKSFMRDIYKKNKPFLVIDPRPPEVVEDFIWNQNMTNRFNMIDPSIDRIGAELMYSLPIFESDLFELRFRRNRWRIEFDVMIMEESMNRAHNVFNRLVMGIRHNSKFTLIRHVPILLPERHVWNIARFHRLEVGTEEFLRFLNSISRYPILCRALNNGKLMYYMQYELHMYVDVPGLPSKDSPEMSEAIEIGARVTDQFIFTADLPSDFVFLTAKENVGKFDRGIKEDPEAITFISPIYADMPWPKEVGEYKLTNKVDIELQAGDKPVLNILEFIKSFDPHIAHTIIEYASTGLPIKELLKVYVYPNGSMQNVGSVLHNDGCVELTNPIYNQLYTCCIYVNLHNVNLIRKGKHTEYVGDLEKY